MARNHREELVHLLGDLYSMELQALAQMVTAPDMAGDPGLAADFRTHCTETERQAQWVRARLEARGGSPSTIKDAIMKLGGKGFLLFARLQNETPGRLLAHAYSYEAMEWAGYAILARTAELADDPETAEVARTIQAEERTMMERLERHFDAAETAAHGDVTPKDLPKHIRHHLAEAHALNVQSAQLLQKGADGAAGPELAHLFRQPRVDTSHQLSQIEDRLNSLGASRSALEDAAMKLGALNWSMFFRSQRDTPSKFLAFSYAVEHLVLAGFELLRRTARRAGDADTEALCQQLIDGKRSIARNLAEGVDLSVKATLAEVQA